MKEQTRISCRVAWQTLWIFVFLLVQFVSPPPARAATNYLLLGWSEMGMYVIDNDYSVYSFHPVGNTIHAQVVELIQGTNTMVLTNPAAKGITVTYSAIADANGSINSTSIGKNNFWNYALTLYGTNLAPDAGISGYPMPGVSTQLMTFTSNYFWFTASDIPITPYDDNGKYNAFPMMRLTVKKGGVAVTNVDIVLPVNDQMDCQLCHGSGTDTNARPPSGWAYDPNPNRDYRLNVLRSHDTNLVGPNAVRYAGTLAANSYSHLGLYAHVTVSNKPILCANCHTSAFPSISGRVRQAGTNVLKPLTYIHYHHAGLTNPLTGKPLDSTTNSATCYTCHGGGGDVTHYMRGASARAVSSNGVPMQCQDCHGKMATVGGGIAGTNRVGWLDEPTCQSCHVGDAVDNVGGTIRYSNAFSNFSNGVLRTTTNLRYGTDTNAPYGTKYSLYRFSNSHSNIMCAACHGPSHADYPSYEVNENRQSIQIQGHEGSISECKVCHGTKFLQGLGGPHGMHDNATNWVRGLYTNTAGTEAGHYYYLLDPTNFNNACLPCHGTNGNHIPDDYASAGTILSRARADRSYYLLTNKMSYFRYTSTVSYARGEIVSCVFCHQRAPGSITNSGIVPTNRPTAGNTNASTSAGVPVTFTLISSTNSVLIRTQPRYGRVALTNKTATYIPNDSFVGTDTFTFVSYLFRRGLALGAPAVSNSVESFPATGTVVVAEVFTLPGEGVPDWWRMKYFTNGTTTNAQSCATCDPDGDGLSNLREFNAGTDPTDPQSTFEIFEMNSATNDIRVGFSTMINRKYAVDYNSSMTTTNPWQPIATNVWGRNFMVQITNTNALSATQRFYRVRARP